MGLIIALLLTVICTSSAFADEIQKETDLVLKCKRILESRFPHTEWDHIKASPIPGICEATTGTNVLYVYPAEKPLFIFGSLFTFTGENLTAERKSQLREELLKKVFKGEVDAKPIRIGKGDPQYVEFVDPFCVHCRRAEKELGDTPRLLFFYPLSERSEAVAAAVLCSRNPQSEWKKVVAGEYDEKVVTAPKGCVELVEEHKDLGRYLGVRGTPTLFDRQGQSPSPTLIASKNKKDRR